MCSSVCTEHLRSEGITPSMTRGGEVQLHVQISPGLWTIWLSLLNFNFIFSLWWDNSYKGNVLNSMSCTANSQDWEWLWGSLNLWLLADAYSVGSLSHRHCVLWMNHLNSAYPKYSDHRAGYQRSGLQMHIFLEEHLSFYFIRPCFSWLYPPIW